MVSTILLPQVDQGIFPHHPDYYAVLGVPLFASDAEVKQAYRKAAMALRSGFVDRSEQAEQASHLFAKLINPAKEHLGRPNQKVEYDTTLRYLARKLMNRHPDLWELVSPNPSIKQLLDPYVDRPKTYVNLIEGLAPDLYTSVDQLSQRLNQLSEINLAFLLLQQGMSYQILEVPSPPAPSSSNSSSPAPSTSTPPPPALRSAPSSYSPSSSSSVRSSFTRARPNPNGYGRRIAPQLSTSYPAQLESAPRSSPSSPPPATPSGSSTPAKLAAKPDPKQAAQQSYQKALEKLKQKNYESAIDLFTTAIAQDPDCSDYYIQRARAHRMLGHLDLACSDYDTVVRLDAYNPEALQGLRDVLEASQKVKPPSSQPSKISVGEPLNPQPSNSDQVPEDAAPTQEQNELEIRKEAERRYEQALKIMHQGHYRQAIRYLDLAIEKNSENSAYYLERARIQKKLSNLGMARSDYKKVLDLDCLNNEAKQFLKETRSLARTQRARLEASESHQTNQGSKNGSNEKDSSGSSDTDRGSKHGSNGKVDENAPKELKKKSRISNFLCMKLM